MMKRWCRVWNGLMNDEKSQSQIVVLYKKRGRENERMERERRRCAATNERHKRCLCMLVYD